MTYSAVLLIDAGKVHAGNEGDGRWPIGVVIVAVDR